MVNKVVSYKLKKIVLRVLNRNRSKIIRWLPALRSSTILPILKPSVKLPEEGLRWKMCAFGVIIFRKALSSEVLMLPISQQALFSIWASQ